MNSANASASHNRILVIDDDPAIHEELRKIFCAAIPMTLDWAIAALPDFQIDSAFHAQEGMEKVAMALASGQPYAIAIVNVRTPPLWEGAETIARISEMDPRIAILLSTVCADESVELLVRKLGNSGRIGVLRKPFDSVQVLLLAQSLAKDALPNLPEEIAGLVTDRLRDLQKNGESLVVETARREFARQALEESGERLFETFGACPLPIAIIGLHDHRCLEVNRAYLATTGRTREDVIGSSVWEAGLCIDTKARLDAMGELAHGRTVRQRDCQLAPMDGALREGLIWIEPFNRAAGRHLVAIVKDGFRESGNFDEVKSLLAAIGEHTKLQSAKSALDSRIGQLLKELRRADQRAAELTRQLFAFRRMHAVEKTGGSSASEAQKAAPADSAPVVLLVDDDEDIRFLAREVLQEAGYHILDAADGHQAITAWREFAGEIDLLLTDMVMPGGLSGTDVAECFKLDRPGGRILFSSGYNVELFDSGSDLREGVNYLPKPYFSRQLLEAVSRVLHDGAASETEPA